MKYFNDFIFGGGWIILCIFTYFFIANILIPIYVAWKDKNGNGQIDENE